MHARRLTRHVLAIVTVAVMVLPTAADAQARPQSLVLATLSDAAEVEVGIAVLREAYRQLGVTIEIRRFAGDVSIDRSSTGAVDGDVQRVDGLRFRFPDLVQVQVPVSYLDLGVFSRDSALRIRSVSDLRPLNVAVVRGIPAIERTIGDLRVRMVDTFAELFHLLDTRQVDAIVAPVLEVDAARARGAVGPGVVRNAIVDTHLQYHYLHRRHADLVPAVDSILREMVLDGTTARLRAAVVTDLLRQPAGGGTR